MGDLDQQFYNTCMTVEYPCPTATKYINPCDCAGYFFCQYTTTIIYQVCAAGTLYNHVSGACEAANIVAVEKKLCDVNKPWERCLAEDDDADIPGLAYRCAGLTTSGPVGSTEGQEGQPGGNTGAIVGGVIAALLLIALVVILFVIYKKRGKPISHYLSFATLKKPVGAKHAEYDNHEDTYAEIKDDMNNPTYNDTVKGTTSSPPVPQRPEFTFSPALVVSGQFDYMKKRGAAADEVAYDNPGYQQDEDTIIQGKTTLNTSSPAEMTSVSLDVPDGSHDHVEESDRSYSPLDRSSLEVPSPKPYQPLSIYTKGPNSYPPGESGGILQLTDGEYQIPKPMPEYYELDPNSSCVS